MKKVLSLLLSFGFLLLFSFQCEQKECCGPPPASCFPGASLSGTWRLEAYQNLSTNQKESNPDADGRGVQLTFAEEGRTGTITGHTAANTVFGSYTKTDSCALTNVTFGGTKVGEPNPWSANVWSAMHGATAFEVGGNELFIYFNGKTERMIFRKN
ncbi:META domain-containing protein [Arundinibacter roseus]|uniref:META domain-containing protein n=1 Tax=Arundinibacter roseus TaxID=2070510 RepID=A0A4R4KR91_9BACT|nr:META domain-containing protein [Arundinibacter roseus]TDB69179.1 META domain-containing protein [Arundinibacter roseus]